MKEYIFEEKGTWVKLDLDGIKHQWDSNENDYRKWPDNISRSYAQTMAEFSKELPFPKKLEMFFHAKGVATKGRLFKEFFRNIPWPYSEEEKEYIEKTKIEATKYFESGIIEF